MRIEGPFEITEIRDGLARRISARAVAPVINPAILSGRPATTAFGPTARAVPLIAVAHLPPVPAAPGVSRLIAAAVADPWPGEIVLRDEAAGAVVGRIARPGHIGVLTAALDAGPEHYWDEANAVGLKLHAGHLSSAEDEGALAGANRIAVRNDAGSWEVIGFAEATLTALSAYTLRRLLRGQQGTGHAIGAASIGNPVIVLDERVVEAPVQSQWLGETLGLRAYAGTADTTGTLLAIEIDAAPALPLAPEHLRAVRDGSGDVTLSWTRRSRADADGWGIADAPLEIAPEAYRVTVLDGVAPVRTIEAPGPTATYSAAQQIADFGGLPPGFVFTVAQVSPVLGAGHAANGDFHA